MQYSVELWTNYNKVYHQFNTHIKGLNDLIGMFSERYKSKKNLAETLKALSESKNTITTFESLTEGILGFKGDMYNQFNYLSEFLIGMRDEIIKPLSSAYQNFSKKIENNFSETSSLNEEYQASVEQMDTFKNQFHSSVFSAEQSKLKAEYFKKKLNILNADKNNEQKNKEIKDNYIMNIKKEENKANNYLKDAKINEKKYISLIHNTNILQDEYIEVKKRNLNEIQELEEELGEIIKDSLRKFIIFQVAYLRNMQYDVDKKAKVLEGINIRNDIQKFINNNKKDTVPPKKFEYIPYISKLNIKKEEKGKKIPQNIPLEIIKEVNNFISSVFPVERLNEIKFLKIKENVDVEQIVFKIFNEEKLNFVDTQEITKLIIKKRSRRLLLNEIKNYKIKNGNNILSDNSYDTINEIFKESLNLVKQDKDYETAKIIINLSNDIFRLINDENNEEICLVNDLKAEKTIKSYEFWKELIKYEIFEEMHQQKISAVRNKKEEKVNINGIVLDKLNIYLNLMINFFCKPNCLRQIIEIFNDYYHLDEMKIKEINKKIDDYENVGINNADLSSMSTEKTFSNVK